MAAPATSDCRQRASLRVSARQASRSWTRSTDSSPSGVRAALQSSTARVTAGGAGRRRGRCRTRLVSRRNPRPHPSGSGPVRSARSARRSCCRPSATSSRASATSSSALSTAERRGATSPRCQFPLPSHSSPATRRIQVLLPGQSQETTDAGATWHAFAADYGQAGPTPPVVIFPDPEVGYATNSRGGFQRTVDGGLHWRSLKTPGCC